jgi:hypothetical protein
MIAGAENLVGKGSWGNKSCGVEGGKMVWGSACLPSGVLCANTIRDVTSGAGEVSANGKNIEYRIWTMVAGQPVVGCHSRDDESDGENSGGGPMLRGQQSTTSAIC